MKNNKGITMIALIITIIILLILAGVSIAMLSGKNGILTKASTSAEATKQANAKERLKVELMAIQTIISSNNNKTKYKHYRLRMLSDIAQSGSGNTIIPYLQFYGK